METSIAAFVKERRRMFNLTQVDLAEKSGVGLRFVRELEQGKQTLRIDKINQVLALFGHEVGAVQINKSWGGEVVRFAVKSVGGYGIMPYPRTHKQHQ